MIAALFALVAQAAFGPTAATPPPAAPSIASAPQPTLWLKQLTITWSPDLDAAAQDARVAAFRAATRTITDCRSADAVAAQQQATVVENKTVSADAFPEQLRDVVAATPVGKATPVFGERVQGARVLVVCARN